MSNPFLSLSYARAIGRARPNARVAVVEEGRKIEAFLPYELIHRGIGGPLGGPRTMLDGIVSSGAALDMRAVVRKAGLRGWRFSHAPAEQRALNRYHYDYSYHGNAVLIINLTDGYDAYLRSRSKSSTKRTAEKRRALERQFGPVSLEWSSKSREQLHQMAEWKFAQFGSVREMYSDATQSAVEELMFADAGDCSEIVSLLSAGERVIAIDLLLAGPRYLCVWQLAYDPNFARFSPGTILFLALIEEAAKRGFTWIDLGYGQDHYKQHLANDSYPIAGGAVWASRVEGASRAIYRRLIYERRMRHKVVQR
jgi:CelD/BcsL family acetyltransferase involved in cellulose biosynthesis